MNEQRFTAGPWTLWTSCSWRRIKDANGASVCEPTIAADGHPDLIIKSADAALICAAPDLLAALQGVLRVADRATVEFDAAHAAIARALPQGAPDA